MRFDGGVLTLSPARHAPAAPAQVFRACHSSEQEATLCKRIPPKLFSFCGCGWWAAANGSRMAAHGLGPAQNSISKKPAPIAARFVPVMTNAQPKSPNAQSRNKWIVGKNQKDIKKNV